jgi:hypothetical protein
MPRPALPPVKEKEVQRQCLDLLALRGVFHFRNNSGAFGGSHKGKRWFVRFGAVGAPDIVAVIGGVFVGIEVKGPRGKLSEDQEAFGRNLTDAGGVYVVVRDVAHLAAVLDDFAKGGEPC